jgi:hypothetical protein
MPGGLIYLTWRRMGASSSVLKELTRPHACRAPDQRGHLHHVGASHTPVISTRLALEPVANIDRSCVQGILPQYG